MDELNLLVISHYFPPVPGVGGRRWAKFVKYLSRKDNVRIHVVSAQNTVKDLVSSFENDLKDTDFNHIVLPSNYPSYLEFLEFSKPTFIGKLMFQVQLYFLKKKVQGNYWDFSVFWKNHFDKTIPDIIRSNKISKLIVSGPPYRYIEYAVGLKSYFPDLEVILDYRDPWNNFNNSTTITHDRLSYELALENKMLKKVDKIITVSEFQKKLILESQPDASPIYVLPNGFDMEDYQLSLRPKEKSDKIKFIHFGTLHFRKDYYWKPFFKAYNRLKNENPELYDLISIDLVGYCPIQVIDFINRFQLDVKIHGILDPFEAYKELNQSDIALWFKYDRSPGDFATKFGDYIALNKHIWTFSVKGTVTDHVEKNKIGTVFYRDDEDLEERIYQAFLGSNLPENRSFNPSYNKEKLQISNLSENLISILMTDSEIKGRF